MTKNACRILEHLRATRTGRVTGISANTGILQPNVSAELKHLLAAGYVAVLPKRAPYGAKIYQITLDGDQVSTETTGKKLSFGPLISAWGWGAARLSNLPTRDVKTHLIRDDASV